MKKNFSLILLLAGLLGIVLSGALDNVFLWWFGIISIISGVLVKPSSSSNSK